VWRASMEATFDVSSDRSVPFTVVSPHPAYIEVLDGTDRAADISILGGGNNFSIYLYAPNGSDRRFAKVRVRATVFGICASSCAKPADEVLKIESQP
jgi:hypothetical protein